MAGPSRVKSITPVYIVQNAIKRGTSSPDERAERIAKKEKRIANRFKEQELSDTQEFFYNLTGGLQKAYPYWMALLTGLTGIDAAKALFSKGSSDAANSALSPADKQAYDALLAAGAPLGSGQTKTSSDSALWNAIKQLGSNNGMSVSSDLLGSGLSAILGVGSQFANSAFNMKNTKELITMQNEYNTPAAQMQRFADAGLNPNLVYGLGSNGNQPASGTPVPVDFDTSQRQARMEMLNYKSDLAAKMANISLMQKQGEEVDARAQAQKMANENYAWSFKADMDIKLQTYNNLIAEEEEKRANAKGQEIKNQYSDRIHQLEIEKSQLEKRILEVTQKWQPWLNSGELVKDIFSSFGAGALGIKSLRKPIVPELTK